MKKIFTLFVTGMLCMYAFNSSAQFNTGMHARFGIDGDLQSDYFQANLLTNAAGSHDWFKNTVGTGLGMIDITGANALLNQMSQGQNITFNKGMAFPMYSIQDNVLQLDARFARDYCNNDLTTFKGGTKNGDNPASWPLNTSATSVTDKADLLDAYYHLRRAGTTVNMNNTSSLYLILGAATLANSGDRNLDFELYRNLVAVNSTTGRFTNTGPAATGGHTIWSFNADGTLKEVGDLMISFTFNSTTISGISVWIWVPEAISKNVNPAGFDFVSNTFFGNAVNNVKYGYVQITGNPGQGLDMLGSVNKNIALAAPWGTNSKSIGDKGNNYFSKFYDAGQFAEVSIDITKLGIDPAFNIPGDACNPPFKSLILKSRSSSSISSALQDFAGPYEFLDAPQPNAQISQPDILTCSNPSTSLKPENYRPGGYYMWSTTDGNIVNQTDPTNTIINKPGSYTLSAAVVKGCNEVRQTIVVKQDISAPVVKTQPIGMLNANPATYVQLNGNATPASSDNLPSSGYTWKWTGPSGFNATTQNTRTYAEGNYQLTATEQRNGCSASAFAIVQKQLTVLPVLLLNFTGKLEKNKTTLSWSVADNETGQYFEIQRSFNGSPFQSIAMIFTTEKAGDETYQFAETASTKTSFYRLKIVNKDGTVLFSNVISFKSDAAEGKIVLLQNPVKNTLRFSLTVPGVINRVVIYTPAGAVAYAGITQLETGNNNYSLPLPSNLPAGVYILNVVTNTGTKTTTFIK